MCISLCVSVCSRVFAFFSHSRRDNKEKQHIGECSCPCLSVCVCYISVRVYIYIYIFISTHACACVCVRARIRHPHLHITWGTSRAHAHTPKQQDTRACVCYNTTSLHSAHHHHPAAAKFFCSSALRGERETSARQARASCRRRGFRSGWAAGAPTTLAVVATRFW